MDDLYSMLRRIQTQIAAPTSYVDPEATGLLQSDSLGPSYHYGDALKGTPYESKYSGAMKQVEPGLFMADFQRPGGHKYDTLSAYYRVDPQTGMATMEGDPFETRQTSKRETVKDFLEHGVPLVAAAAGAGYAMGGAGAGAGASGGLSGVDAAMADYAASGGGGGLFAGGGAAAGGIGTLGTLPEVPGQVAGLSTMGQFTMPELASAAYVPTMAELGAGAGGLLSAAGKGAGAAASAAQSSGGYGDLAKLGLTALGAYEGYQGNDPTTSTNVRTLDPRIDSKVFGTGGLLSNADEQFQRNKATGQNDTMRQSQDWLRGMLSSPEAQQGLARMYGSSQGLLSSPVAGNPFLNFKFGG